MKYADIYSIVQKVIKEYDTNDPFRLCQAMRITVNFLPLGTSQSAIKGFFIINRRVRCITINSDLPESVQRIIAAHELGHAALHKNRALAFHEINLFDESSKLEKEANLFASELLLEDAEVLDVLNCGTPFFSAAANMQVPPELLDFKLRLMARKGYQLSVSPITAQSNFLKDMELPEYDS